MYIIHIQIYDKNNEIINDIKESIDKKNQSGNIIDNIQKEAKNTVINHLHNDELYDKSNYYNWSQNVLYINNNRKVT